jgi:hypothetical protein
MQVINVYYTLVISLKIKSDCSHTKIESKTKIRRFNETEQLKTARKQKEDSMEDRRKVTTTGFSPAMGRKSSDEGVYMAWSTG